MVRTPSYDKSGLKKGTWTPEEDQKLIAYVTKYGCWNWRQLPRFAGLTRCGKSCRLRWMNYLRPNIKRGNYTPQEEELIIKLHKDMGNRWSAIAAHLPGRTDNEIKNHWHTTLKKRSQHNSSTTNKSKKSKDTITSISKPHSASSSSSLSQIETLDSGPLSPQSSSYSSSCITTSSGNSCGQEDDLSFLDALITEPETQNSLLSHLNLDDMFYDDPTETIMPAVHAPPNHCSLGFEDDFAFLDSLSQTPLESFLIETQMADVANNYPQAQPHASLGDELEYLYPPFDIDLWSQST